MSDSFVPKNILDVHFKESSYMINKESSIHDVPIWYKNELEFNLEAGQNDLQLGNRLTNDERYNTLSKLLELKNAEIITTNCENHFVIPEYGVDGGYQIYTIVNDHPRRSQAIKIKGEVTETIYITSDPDVAVNMNRYNNKTVFIPIISDDLDQIAFYAKSKSPLSQICILVRGLNISKVTSFILETAQNVHGNIALLPTNLTPVDYQELDCHISNYEDLEENILDEREVDLENEGDKIEHSKLRQKLKMKRIEKMLVHAMKCDGLNISSTLVADGKGHTCGTILNPESANGYYRVEMEGRKHFYSLYEYAIMHDISDVIHAIWFNSENGAMFKYDSSQDDIDWHCDTILEVKNC